MDLKATKPILGSLRDHSLAAFCCGLFDDSLGGSSPRPFLKTMGLNGDGTLYGKSQGSNQAAFVVDFSKFNHKAMAIDR